MLTVACRTTEAVLSEPIDVGEHERVVFDQSWTSERTVGQITGRLFFAQRFHIGKCESFHVHNELV